MSVVAKFYVNKVTKHAGNGGCVEVHLLPVTRGDENKGWSKWTPSGEIRIGILNEAASAWYEDRLGKEILVTFDDAPA